MIDQLSNWLEKQGYPLEMRVAEAFRRADFAVVQSRYFEDPDEGTFREVDLTAARVDIEKRLGASIVFTIECKSSPDKPWLLFTSNDVLQDHILRRLEGTAHASSEARKRIGQRAQISDPQIQLIHPGPSYGYGVTQAFTSGPDICYRAIYGAVKAAVSRVQQADESGQFILAVPVVIVESRLFQCSLNKSGGIQLEEVTMGTLWWRNRVGAFSSPKVRIVTEPALPEFIAAACSTADYLLEQAPLLGLDYTGEAPF